MGKKNNVMCNYLEKPERFADFVNGSLYGGKQVILPEQIMERQTEKRNGIKSENRIAEGTDMSRAEFLSGIRKRDRLSSVHFA